MKINLASNRLAFFLIGLLFLLILLSAIIPQAEFAEEQLVDWRKTLGENYWIIDNLGLDRIYRTPVFFGILALLGLNLLVANIGRFRKVYRTERTLFRVRHLGSILFHFSIMAIMASVILNYLFKYDGLLGVTEGQTVNDQPQSYTQEFRGPLFSDTYERFSLTLRDVSTHADATGGYTDTARTEFVLPGGVEISSAIATGKPLSWQGLEFHYGPVTGYSPELVILDSTDQTVFRSFVRVAAHRESGETIHRDFIELQKFGLSAKFEIAPGAYPAKPASCHLDIVSDGGESVQAWISRTDTISVDHYRITVPRIRRWCYINVVGSPYLTLVFTGFWAALGGLALSLVARILPEQKR